MANEVNVDLNKCDDIVCECGNALFVQCFTLKRIPGLLIAQTKDKIVNVAQMVCSSCGALYQAPEIKPEKFKEKVMKALTNK